MHSLFELLLISFSISSSNVARASELPDNVDFTPYVKSNYFDTQRDDGRLLVELVGGLESRSLGSVVVSQLFERQLQGGMRSDLQTFTGALGGIRAPSIVQSNDRERPFEVEGNMFSTYMEAAIRSCDVQKNDCSDMVNAQGAGGAGGDNKDQAEGQDGDDADEQVEAPRHTTTTRAGSSSAAAQNPQGTTQTNQNNAPSSRPQQQNPVAEQGTATTAPSSTRTSSTASRSTTMQKNSGNRNQQQGDNGNGTVSVNNKLRRQNRVTLDMCDQQMAQCNTVVRSAAIQTFDLVNLGPDPNDPDFDLLCAP